MFTRDDVLKASLEYFGGDPLAADVFLKYALTDGEVYLERTPEDMHRRLAGEFARTEMQYPNPVSFAPIMEALSSWEIVAQGSPSSAVGNDARLESASNCFVIDGPLDSYGGIFRADEEQVQLMKRRGGVGFDISAIRPKGVSTTNAARTTDGIGVFMERYSNSCREVAQSGRRGALMLTLSVHHPEVMTFIGIKMDETKVTGANVSVRVSDAFMQAVVDDQEYIQQWPVDVPVEQASIVRRVRARTVWEEIIRCAHARAEPGVLFWDTVTREGSADVYPEFRSTATNPCFTGDTLVAVADGRGLVRFDQLVADGVDTSVYCVAQDGSTQVRTMRDPRKTGDAVPVVRVSFSGGQSVRVTPSHKFYLDSRQEKEAQHLCPEDSLWGTDLRVLSVTPADTADVYNGTVDDFHNYFIGFPSDTSQILVNVKNCGEIPLTPYDSCRLMVLNLPKFVLDPFTSQARFDVDRYQEQVMLGQRLMDDLVDLELEKVSAILAKIDRDKEPDEYKQVERELWHKIYDKGRRGRRTGLGVTGLGDALAMLNLRYGSPESIQATEAIYKAHAVAAYTSSVQLAEERGSFEGFDWELEKDHPYLSRIYNALDSYSQDQWRRTGRRNVACLTTAPVGSISCMTQTTSGIEPAFLLSYTRRRKLTESDHNLTVDLVDAQGDRWHEYTVYHHAFADWMRVTGLSDVKDSPYWGGTSNDIDWVKAVEIQSVAQKWIDHAISKTINLPADVSPALVSDVYLAGWRGGCKGLTVYRDGCRTGVLVSTDKAETKETKFLTHQAPKRPKELPCQIFHERIDGHPWVILVGMMDDRPYEVFGGLAEHLILDKEQTHGVIRKRSGSPARYDLTCANNLAVRDIAETFSNPNHSALTRVLSLTLRHGTPIQYVVEQLQRDRAATLSSFSRVIARVLKRYIQDGTRVSGAKGCPSCDAQNSLKYQEGCVTCTVCGFSKCG